MRAIDAATAVVAALLLAVTLWMAWQVRTFTPPERVVLALRSAPRLPAAGIVAPRALVPMRRTQLPEPPTGLSRVRICGAGDVDLPVPQREAEAAVSAVVIEPMALRVSERLLPQFDASADEHDRALAHFIVSRLGGSAAPVRREALAVLAMNARDPRTYRLALIACGSLRAEGTCRRLSNERWAQLDADNAAPWLALAQEAFDRGDHAGVADALFRASRAQRSDLAFSLGGAARLMQHRAIAELPTVERLAVASLLHSIWAAIPERELAVPGRYCMGATADPNRRELCSGLASLFLERDGTLLGFGVGLRLAELADWETERQQQLKDEFRALAAAVSRIAGRSGQPSYDCKWWRAVERHDAQIAAVGEIAAARSALAESAPRR